MPFTFGKESKKKKDVMPSENGGFKGLTNWVHRIEQQMNSLEKRLDAIERRLSGEPFESPHFSKASSDGREKGEKIYEALQQEISSIKKDIKALQSQQWKPQQRKAKEREEPVTISLSRKNVRENYAKELASIERRLERLEKSRKAAPTVKVGRIEVPIEITGIVGALFAFIIAAFLLGGYKDLVVSPPFVVTIGIVLLATTALKTYIINMERK